MKRPPMRRRERRPLADLHRSLAGASMVTIEKTYFKSTRPTINNAKDQKAAQT